jgi:hypothetical protein
MGGSARRGWEQHWRLRHGAGCERKSVETRDWEAARDDGSTHKKVLGFRVGNETG